MPRSETVGRLAVQLAKALDGVCTLSAERGHGVAGQFDLPRAEDLGMAGQDLLDERRAGSRQPHDEHREFAFQPKAADPLEEIRRADRDHPGDERLVLFRVVLLAALAPLGQLQGVAPIEVLGGLGILAPRVQDLGQAEVQATIVVRPSNPSPPATGAAQPDPPPEVCRPGVPPICNVRRRTGNCAATRRGSSLPRPEDRLSPPKRCPGCCAPRQSPASVPVPGGSRRPLRPASLGPSTHCPGCCVPGQSPASVPVPGGSRRPLRPASPGPSTHCPGCCVPGQSPASVSVPGGNRQPLRPASPVLSTHCPGCYVPRHSPASVPMRGGSRRWLRPASPVPSRRLPRLLCASA